MVANRSFEKPIFCDAKMKFLVCLHLLQIILESSILLLTKKDTSIFAIAESGDEFKRETFGFEVKFMPKTSKTQIYRSIQNISFRR
jgi:hypothetical protein